MSYVKSASDTKYSKSLNAHFICYHRLPDPCKDHALVMARFARDIIEKLNQLTHRLESSLGPDTGDLDMVSSILLDCFAERR
jgi:hypothetical protein